MALVWNAAKIGKMLVDIDFNLIQKLSRFSPGIFVLYCVCLLAAYVVHERRWLSSFPWLCPSKLTNVDFIRYARHLADNIKLSLCAAGVYVYFIFIWMMIYSQTTCHLPHHICKLFKMTKCLKWLLGWQTEKCAVVSVCVCVRGTKEAFHGNMENCIEWEQRGKNKHEIPPTTTHTFLLNASNQFLDLDSPREYNTACCRQKVTCRYGYCGKTENCKLVWMLSSDWHLFGSMIIWII